MDYLALACDCDGTLTRSSSLSRPVINALARLRAASRRVILVTGEREEDFAELEVTGLFDLIIGENGALLHRPGRRGSRSLAASVPPNLVRVLRRRGVKPLKVGRSILSTKKSHDVVISDILAKKGLDWSVLHNRRNVMVLPAGVNKATGLAAAARALGLAPCQIVGVGDAENDVDLIRACGCGVAVADAVAVLKKQAMCVTAGRGPRGAVEVIDRLLAGDLPRPRRSLAG